MTLPKKSIHKLPAEVDWVKIIQAIAVGVVLILQAWGNSNASRVEKKVDVVKRQSDGQTTAMKLQVANSAKALSLATKDPEHIKLAEQAQAAYEAHVKNQEKAEEPKP